MIMCSSIENVYHTAIEDYALVIVFALKKNTGSFVTLYNTRNLRRCPYAVWGRNRYAHLCI